MGNRYAFGHNAKCAVEVPELDAFLADIDAVCKKHGVGVEVERDYDANDKFRLVPYEMNELEALLTKDLDDYRGGGVPWLDAAADAYEKNRSALYDQEKADRRRAEIEAKLDYERRLLEDGIRVGDKRYKLVPTE